MIDRGLVNKVTVQSCSRRSHRATSDVCQQIIIVEAIRLLKGDGFDLEAPVGGVIHPSPFCPIGNINPCIVGKPMQGLLCLAAG
jgi:hypothetical protein